MPKAIWKDAVIAESDQTQIVEGNHYFPPQALHEEYFKESSAHTICPCKGTASYYDVVVGEDVNEQAAWYYPDPKKSAANIKGHIAFWRGVVIQE